MSTVPALPAGYQLDTQGTPPLPDGYQLDSAAQEKPKPRTWLDSVGDAAAEWWKQVNPVSSVKGLAEAVNSPIQTGKALLENQGQIEKKAEAAFKRGDYAEGVRHVLNYLLPVLGQQTDQAGDLAQSGQYARAAGQTLGLATNLAVPELIKGTGLRVPTGELPERLYQSALKPGPGSYSTSEVGSMVKTGLKNDIPVSAGGASKLDTLISNLSDRVKAQIQAGSQAGATVDPAAIAARADQAKGRFAVQVNPDADLAAIDASKQEFLKNNPSPIPVADAQNLKQGTYQQLKSRSYGELGSATKEAQKALARGIKEELEVQFPEIKGLNAQQSQMIGLSDALERAVRRIDNRQLISFGTPIAAVGGAALGGGLGATAGIILKQAIDDSFVKSKLAIALTRASSGQIALPAALARVAGYSDALGNALPTSREDQQ